MTNKTNTFIEENKLMVELNGVNQSFDNKLEYEYMQLKKLCECYKIKKGCRKSMQTEIAELYVNLWDKLDKIA